MKLMLIMIIVIGFILSCNSQDKIKTYNDIDIVKAIKSSEQWLATIDSNNYKLSWEKSAEIFKKSISKKNWVKALKKIRTPMGNLRSRELQTNEFRTSLPGAPDGEYVIIVYKTNFENKENSYETITPMKEEDGEWRISGYYIK